MNNLNFTLDSNIDEDFFSSLKGKSSKLQQLFVEDEPSSDDRQHSLKYQRPKDVATTSIPSATTLMAKVVTAYRQDELQGKVGLALIQNSDNTYNIIIYKTKAQILVALKLQPEKNLLYNQAKFWQFYDGLSTYWSFSFNTEMDEKEFIDKLHMKGITFKKSTEKEQVTGNQLAAIKSNDEGQSADHDDFAGSVILREETKGSLIKRMAKMGKPLPTLSSHNQQVTTEFSDSSDTEVIKTPLASIQKPSIAPRRSCSKANQQLIPSIVGFNSISTTAGTSYPLNPFESQYMQMLLSEQRSHGTELRMNMNKLENKIEKVLDKLDVYSRKDGYQKTEKEDEILELEEKLLMLKKENRRLKQNLQENSSKESKENEVKHLLYEFKDDLEHLNIDHKQDLKNILIELNYRLKQSHTKLNESQKKQDVLELKLKEMEAELELKRSKYVELENEVRSLKQQENELKLLLNKRETEIKMHEQEVLDLQNKLHQKDRRTPDNALVKSIMNNFYMDIMDKLNEINIPHSEQILSLIASSIKQQTLQSLQNNLSTDE